MKMTIELEVVQAQVRQGLTREAASRITDLMDEGAFDHLHAPLRYRLVEIARALDASRELHDRAEGWLSTMTELVRVMEKEH